LDTREKSVHTNGIEGTELNKDTGDDIERGRAITNASVNKETTEIVEKVV